MSCTLTAVGALPVIGGGILAQVEWCNPTPTEKVPRWKLPTAAGSMAALFPAACRRQARRQEAAPRDSRWWSGGLQLTGTMTIVDESQSRGRAFIHAPLTSRTYGLFFFFFFLNRPFVKGSVRPKMKIQSLSTSYGWYGCFSADMITIITLPHRRYR